MQTSRTFRVFISSTFSDLKAERNALQENVFPRLRALAAARGCRFQAIDLRWGVSEEAALDQQTMKICLGEIERCQAVSPRPNFIVLLGDRYGWRPLPFEIPEAEYDQVVAPLSAGERVELASWYRKDENAVPPCYALQVRTGEMEAYAAWGPVEEKLHNLLEKGARQAGLPAADLLKYTASATEQEIVSGALCLEDAREHVFGYFRKIENLPQGRSASGFIDLGSDGEFDQKAARQLAELKQQLTRHLDGHTHEYITCWGQEGPGLDHLDQFCQDVTADLEAVILHELSRLGEADPFVEEDRSHQDFGAERARDFMGRASALNSISRYLSAESRQPLILWGESGCGKSALLARAAQLARQELPQAEVIVRFLGTSQISSTPAALLENLCQQIFRQLELEKDQERRLGAIKASTPGQHQYLADSIRSEYRIPQDFDGLVRTFSRFLAFARPDKPLIVFLDALDQLVDVAAAGGGSWLPFELPPFAHLVVSTLAGEGLNRMQQRLPSDQFVELLPLSQGEGEQLLDGWLERGGRTLTTVQREALLSGFRLNGLPLYLKLAFEAARGWRSYDPIRTLAPDVPGMIRALFGRLARPQEHGDVLVRRSLAYLCAARHGLTEDEMLDLLARDAEVLEDFRRRSPNSPHSDRLPFIIWSRLYFDLAAYLVGRIQNGTAILSFYHNQLRQVAGQDYLAPEREFFHRQLASYFSSLPTWQGAFTDSSRKASQRKVQEYPWQLLQLKDWPQLETILCDLTFIEAKCSLGLTAELMDDYRAVLAALPESVAEQASEAEGQVRLERYQSDLIEFSRQNHPDRSGGMVSGGLRPSIPIHRTPLQEEQVRYPEGGAVSRLERLRAYARFIQWQGRRLEAAAELPLLVIQQAQNSARSGPVAEAARTLLGTLDDQPPLLLADPVREEYCPNPGRLASVEDPFTERIALGADGHRLVSFSKMGYAVWSLPSGRCLQRSYFRQPDSFSLLDVSADARLALCYASSSREIVLLDLDSGIQRASIPDHKQDTRAALSPDGGLILTGDERGRMALFSLPGGELLREYQAGQAPIWKVALSNDNRTIVCGDREKEIRVWDSQGSGCRFVLKGHEGPITDLILSADGSRLISGDQEGWIKTWELGSGRCLQSVKAYKTSIYDSYCMDASADGGLLVTCGNGELHIRDAGTGRVLRTLIGVQANALRLLCDGSKAVTAVSGRFDVWDIENGLSTMPVNGDRHARGVVHLAMDEAGERVLSIGMDGKAILWGGEDMHLRQEIPDFQARWGEFSRDGIFLYSSLLSGEGSGWLKIFEQGKLAKSLAQPTWGNGFEYSLDGRVLRSGGWTIDLEDLKSHLPSDLFSSEVQRRNPVQLLSQDGSRLAVQHYSLVRIFNPLSGVCLRRILLRPPKGAPTSSRISLSPDGRLLLSWVGAEKLVQYTVYSTEDGCLLGDFELTGRFIGQPVFQKNCRLVWIGIDDQLEQWDLTGPHLVKNVPGRPKGHFVLSADERYAISYDEIWDLEQGRRIAMKWSPNEYDPGKVNDDLSIMVLRGESLMVVGRDRAPQRYRLANLRFSIPVVVPTRLWRPGKNHKGGKRDAQLSVLCEWCRKRFPVDVGSMDGAGDTVAIMDWRCPGCQQPLRLTRCIVDNQDDPLSAYQVGIFEWNKRSKAAYTRAMEACNTHDLDAALLLLEEAENWFRVRDSEVNLAYLLRAQAAVLYQKGLYARGMAACLEACHLLEQAGKEQDLAECQRVYDALREKTGEH